MPVQSRCVLQTHLIFVCAINGEKVEDVVVTHALFSFDTPASDFFVAGVLVIVVNEIFVHGVPSVVGTVNAGFVGGLNIGGLVVYNIPTPVIGWGYHGIDPINVPGSTEEDTEQIVDCASVVAPVGDCAHHTELGLEKREWGGCGLFGVQEVSTEADTYASPLASGSGVTKNGNGLLYSAHVARSGGANGFFDGLACGSIGVEGWACGCCPRDDINVVALQVGRTIAENTDGVVSIHVGPRLHDVLLLFGRDVENSLVAHLFGIAASPGGVGSAVCPTTIPFSGVDPAGDRNSSASAYRSVAVSHFVGGWA